MTSRPRQQELKCAYPVPPDSNTPCEAEIWAIHHDAPLCFAHAYGVEHKIIPMRIVNSRMNWRLGVLTGTAWWLFQVQVSVLCYWHVTLRPHTKLFNHMRKYSPYTWVDYQGAWDQWGRHVNKYIRSNGNMQFSDDLRVIESARPTTIMMLDTADMVAAHKKIRSGLTQAIELATSSRYKCRAPSRAVVLFQQHLATERPTTTTEPEATTTTCQHPSELP